MEFHHEHEKPYHDEEQLLENGVEGVRALVQLARALIAGQESLPTVEIEEQILKPAERCTRAENRELARLCCVFSMVLERAAQAVLEAVAEYLVTADGDGCLRGFTTSMKIITQALVDAYETSLLEAFRMGLRMELYCGRI